jgi:hypothetical protein
MAVPADISDTVKAYVKGFNIGAQLDTGDEFLGAIPEADKYFQHDSAEHNMFCFGYVDGLKARFDDGVVPCTFSRDSNESFIL